MCVCIHTYIHIKDMYTHNNQSVYTQQRRKYNHIHIHIARNQGIVPGPPSVQNI